MKWVVNGRIDRTLKGCLSAWGKGTVLNFGSDEIIDSQRLWRNRIGVTIGEIGIPNVCRMEPGAVRKKDTEGDRRSNNSA